MSPRAAWRLEQLGFTSVYEYTAGKVDWLAAGEPTEHQGTFAARVLSALDAAVPTCQLDDRAGLAAGRAAASGWPICVVLNPAGVVAGRLRVDSIAADDQRTADEAMEPGQRRSGPTTTCRRPWPAWPIVVSPSCSSPPLRARCSAHSAPPDDAGALEPGTGMANRAAGFPTRDHDEGDAGPLARGSHRPVCDHCDACRGERSGGAGRPSERKLRPG